MSLADLIAIAIDRGDNAEGAGNDKDDREQEDQPVAQWLQKLTEHRQQVSLITRLEPPGRGTSSRAPRSRRPTG
jgi:hypothetical protein